MTDLDAAGTAELTRLTTQRLKRGLTAKELRRIAFLTFKEDPHHERDLWIREQAPDLWVRFTVEHRAYVEQYEAQRSQAIAEGRDVAGVPEDRAAVMAQLVIEVRATDDVPAEYSRDLDPPRRAAFAELACSEGLGAPTMAAWWEWMAARNAAQAFLARRSDARAALGLSGSAVLGLPSLSLLREFAAATGDKVFDAAHARVGFGQ